MRTYILEITLRLVTMLLPLLCLLPLLPLARAQCSLLSVSECKPDPDEVIVTIPLPSDQEAAIICQQLCGIQDDCEFWSFDKDSLSCDLLAYCYLHTCDSFVAGPDPDFTECLCQGSGTCDDFTPENCDLLGNVLWQSDVVIDASHCQEYLQVLGPVYGGSVFSYSHTSHTCTILDTGARHCSKVSGPRQPSLEQCEAATTTTAPVTTTPAPTSGDGRC